jgi:hypothetical protein
MVHGQNTITGIRTIDGAAGLARRKAPSQDVTFRIAARHANRKAEAWFSRTVFRSTSARCVKCIFVASVAQWIEHFSPKEGVVGSIPIWGTLHAKQSVRRCRPTFLFHTGASVFETRISNPKIAGFRSQLASLCRHGHTPSTPLSPHRRKPTSLRRFGNTRTLTLFPKQRKPIPLRTYGNTPTALLSPYRHKPTSLRRYEHTPPRPLSPYRHKPTSLRWYGHTPSTPLSPYRRKTALNKTCGMHGRNISSTHPAYLPQ